MRTSGFTERLSAGRTFLRAVGRAAGPLVVLLAAVSPVAAQSGGVVQVENRAVIRFLDSTGREWMDTARATMPVQMRVLPRDLALELEAVVSGPLRAGDTLTYRITVGNRSAEMLLRNVVVTHELPQELNFIGSDTPLTGVSSGAMSARPAANSPRWRIAELALGETRVIEMSVEVQSVASGAIATRATARSDGMDEAVATSVAVAVTDPQPPAPEASVALESRASVAEVGVAGPVGFTVVIRNTSAGAVAGATLRASFPTGLDPQPGTEHGALMMEAGREPRFALPVLAPGDSVVVRYAATAGAEWGSVLRHATWVELADGTRTDTSWTAVRVRDGRMATRAVLGRVWLDDSGDGRQQPGERGLGHAIVWVSSGEMVRADAEGRFSLPDLRPGRYTLRVDPLSVPAGYLPGDVASIRVDGWTTPSVGFGLRRDTTIVVADEAAVDGIALAGGLFVPRPRVAAPANGAVLPNDRVYVRVEGEASRPVALYVGGALIRESVLRPDGVEDFIGVPLRVGPNTIEAVVRGAAGEQRHAISVHVSGSPHRFERADSAEVRAGATSLIAVRVLDEWGVAVAQGPHVTVTADGLDVLAEDANRGSYGLQVPVNANGVALVPVRADSTGAARLTLQAGQVRGTFPLAVLPDVRGLILLADGEVSVGAASRNYGALLARGALDERTAVTVSYDSRNRRPEDGFGGAYDALDESRYLTLGDNSERIMLRSLTTPVSLRIERDRSWLLLGDMDTRGFGEPGTPGSYNRALPGVSGQLHAGAVELLGFGSLVGQQLVQHQMRGNGSSGPYHVGGAVRLGTDRVAIETRDRLNASLVLARHELERFVDYDMDAAGGAILLRRPLPSADAAGNPLMLVVLAEQLFGEESFVGGVRAQVDVVGALGVPADSAVAGAAFIEDRSTLGGHSLVSADARLAAGPVGARVEVARGAAGDSAGLAIQAAGWLGGASDRLSARLEWNRTGGGFHNPANPRLVAGTEDVRLAGAVRLDSAWRVEAMHSQQWFSQRGAARSRTLLGAERRQGASRMTLEGGVQEESSERSGVTSSLRSALVRAAWETARTAIWVEGSEPLSGSTMARPRSIGAGAAYRVLDGVRLEAGHHVFSTDSATWGVTSAGVRTEFGRGTRAWTQMEQSGGAVGVQRALLAGLGQKLSLGGGWGVDAMVERRAGISRLPETDPMRTLPFPELEEDRWTVAGGVAWAPEQRDVMLGLRAELHDRESTGRGYRVVGTAEAVLDRSWALLLRQDAREDRRLLDTGVAAVRASHSMAALAYRPANRSDWNGLFKLERRRDENPMRAGGAVLNGVDARIIAAAEGIWVTEYGTELGGRYAIRFSELTGEAANGWVLRSHNHYVGARVRQPLMDRLDARLGFRVLGETRSELAQWDLSPALGFRLLPGLELETGYRFGDLSDRDFAPDGRGGWYLSLGMSVTEQTGRNMAENWRARMGGGR